MFMTPADLLNMKLSTLPQEAQVPPETTGPEIPVYGKNIPVPAASQTINPEDLVPRDIGNADFAEEAAKANNTTQERLNDKGLQHKGMFGLKGTLRDVLGLLGDSFLVGSGHASEYDKVRQREREGDAMAGFTQDPSGAAERLSGVNPAAAKIVQGLAIQEQIRKAQLESVNIARQQQEDARRFQVYTNAQKVISNIFASPVAQTNPDLALRQAKFIAQRSQVPLEEFGLHENMTPEEVKLLAAQNMTPNQAAQLPYKERMTAVAEQNADANTTRANRPPAGRAPPVRNIGQVDAEVADAVLSGRATPDQIKYYNDRLKHGTGRGTPRPSGVVGPPPGFKLGRKLNP